MDHGSVRKNSEQWSLSIEQYASRATLVKKVIGVIKKVIEVIEKGDQGDRS